MLIKATQKHTYTNTCSNRTLIPLCTYITYITIIHWCPHAPMNDSDVYTVTYQSVQTDAPVTLRLLVSLLHC